MQYVCFVFVCLTYVFMTLACSLALYSLQAAFGELLICLPPSEEPHKSCTVAELSAISKRAVSFGRPKPV